MKTNGIGRAPPVDRRRKTEKVLEVRGWMHECEEMGNGLEEDHPHTARQGLRRIVAAR